MSRTQIAVFTLMLLVPAVRPAPAMTPEERRQYLEEPRDYNRLPEKTRDGILQWMAANFTPMLSRGE